MSNAVSELALLNYGQVIPAEFWPGHESHFLDNDLHRPWWERIPNPESELTGEELWEQRLELWEHLSTEEENGLELDYLMETLGLHGGVRSFYEDYEIPPVSFHRPPPADAVVNNRWTPYVSLDEKELPEELPSSEHELSFRDPRQFSGKVALIRELARKHYLYPDAQGRLLTRHEASRQLRRLGESRPQSHGWRGRTRQKYHQVHV